MRQLISDPDEEDNEMCTCQEKISFTVSLKTPKCSSSASSPSPLSTERDDEASGEERRGGGRVGGCEGGRMGNQHNNT